MLFVNNHGDFSTALSVNTTTKLSLITALLVLFTLVVWILRPIEPIFDDDRATDGELFEVYVVKPRTARPLFGILPDGFLGLPPYVLHFDHTSPGATVGVAGRHRLELLTDNWRVVIETDETDNITPNTYIIFPLELGNRYVTLKCRPEPPLAGTLQTDDTYLPDKISGTFEIKVSHCVNIDSEKTVNWPPQPLTVYGRFFTESS